MKKSLFSAIAVGLCMTANVMAQIPNISWQKCFGGTNYDVVFNSIIDNQNLTSVGVSQSMGGLSIFQCDLNGNLIWEQILDSGLTNYGYSISKTIDGGYFIVGQAYDVNTPGYIGQWDFIAYKLDLNRNIEWRKCFGGNSFDEVPKCFVSSDGSLYLSGTTFSNNLNSSTNHGEGDILVIKLDPIGNVIWQKCFGGSGSEYGSSYGGSNITETQNGELLIVGAASSLDGDVQGFNQSSDPMIPTDGWVIKIDNNGTLLWQKCLGGTGQDKLNSIALSQTGEIYVVGFSESIDNGIINKGEKDLYIAKLSSTGQLIWQKTYGGYLSENANSIKIDQDGILVLGQSSSNDYDISGNHGDSDFCLFKFDFSGNIIWQKSLGGQNADVGYNVLTTVDGSIFLFGETASNNGEVTGNHGGVDAWIVKLSNNNVSLTEVTNSEIKIYPNPSNDHIIIDAGDLSTMNGYSIKIEDAQGQQVFQNAVNQQQFNIDITSWGGNGLYFVRIIDPQGNTVDSKKIVLQ
jgi:hypothetical protein